MPQVARGRWLLWYCSRDCATRPGVSGMRNCSSLPSISSRCTVLTMSASELDLPTTSIVPGAPAATLDVAQHLGLLEQLGVLRRFPTQNSGVGRLPRLGRSVRHRVRRADPLFSLRRSPAGRAAARSRLPLLPRPAGKRRLLLRRRSPGDSPARNAQLSAFGRPGADQGQVGHVGAAEVLVEHAVGLADRVRA